MAGAGSWTQGEGCSRHCRIFDVPAARSPAHHPGGSHVFLESEGLGFVDPLLRVARLAAPEGQGRGDGVALVAGTGRGHGRERLSGYRAKTPALPWRDSRVWASWPTGAVIAGAWEGKHPRREETGCDPVGLDAI